MPDNMTDPHLLDFFTTAPIVNISLFIVAAIAIMYLSSKLLNKSARSLDDLAESVNLLTQKIREDSKVVDERDRKYMNSFNGVMVRMDKVHDEVVRLRVDLSKCPGVEGNESSGRKEGVEDERHKKSY